jgi:serine/threonine-protein kinase
VPDSGSDDETIGNVPFEPGTVLQDTYRIDGLIASGGMGDVYRATHERLQGALAIKVLHRDLVSDESLLARFRTEAKIMAGLHHPHIVRVFDFNVTAEGVPYLAMELAEGSDLRSVTAKQRALPPQRVSQIITQVASALGAAHAHGIVHRDLKPENVMLVRTEDDSVYVKVVDFGVSKTRDFPRITVEAALIGTPEFMAPEQAQGASDAVDHRADQFALGILAYYLFTGREPFRGSSPVAVLYQVVHEEAAALRHFVGWPSDRTDAVIRRAMSKDRDRRFASTVEFAAALQEAVAVDLAQDAGASEATASSAGAVDVAETTFDLQASRAVRRPWRMAMFLFAVVCVTSFLLSLDAAKAWTTGSRSETAYRVVTEGAVRMLARARAFTSFSSSARAATASGEVP